MKIGILLTGIAYGKQSDFRNDYPEFFKSIYDPIVSQGHEVSVYLTTYKSFFDKMLLDVYQPKKYAFLDYEGSEQKRTYITSLNLLLEEDLDFIVATRFDIELIKKITEFDYDYDKINFLYGLDVPEAPWKSHNYVTDNIFMFNKKYLDVVIASVKSMIEAPPVVPYTGMHEIYRRMKTITNTENIKIILEEKGTTENRGKYYKLRRSNLDGNSRKFN